MIKTISIKIQQFSACFKWKIFNINFIDCMDDFENSHVFLIYWNPNQIPLVIKGYISEYYQIILGSYVTS